MEGILLIWQYPFQVSLGLWSSLIGTMLTWSISQKQIFYDCVLPFKTTKDGGQREKCNVKLDHNARITAGQSGPGKEAELGDFYSGTQKTVSKALVSTISEWNDCMQKNFHLNVRKLVWTKSLFEPNLCLNQIFQFAELVTTLTENHIMFVELKLECKVLARSEEKSWCVYLVPGCLAANDCECGCW